MLLLLLSELRINYLVSIELANSYNYYNRYLYDYVIIFCSSLEAILKSLITIISPAKHSEYYISVVTNVVLYCHFKQFSMGIIPLCSEQFRKTFNTTRIPLKEQGNFCFTGVLSLVKLFYHKFKSFSYVMNYGTIFAASQQWKKSCINL